MELKEKLVALRKEKGLTQSAVAEKLDVSRQTISRWESGIALPSTDNLKSLSALYGVPIDYLLNSDVERERDQVQTDMHCGEQAIPQRKDKRKRVIIGLAILLLVAIVMLMNGFRPEWIRGFQRGRCRSKRKRWESYTGFPRMTRITLSRPSETVRRLSGAGGTGCGTNIFPRRTTMN